MKWSVAWLLLQCLCSTVHSFCEESCNGHGNCGEKDSCECFDDWTGFSCNERLCPFGLGWTTRDADDLLSMSTPNYPQGKHAYEECSGKGACDRSTGICDCVNGYTGIGCRRTSCPNDCNGNGICVTNAEAAPEGYESENVLRFQKQQWDNEKTTQCLCDTGFVGPDCSVRICPEGIAYSECSDGAAYHNDVQAVTVSFTDTFATMAIQDFDNYFALEFTDSFNAKSSTRPISYWEDALAVQQALLALPGYAVDDVTVTKFWPLQDYSSGIDSDSYFAGSTLEAASTFRPLACETWYYDAFESAACSTDSDCADKFGLVAGTTVLCESDLGICIETEGGTNCVVDDAIDEFVTDECAANFEPDGIYQSVTVGGSFWGRRLGAHDRKCHIGLFAPDDSFYAVSCTTNADCKPCALNTQVTAGECIGNVCTPSPTFTGDFVTADLEECSAVTFLINFDVDTGGSKKNLLQCNVGENTNNAGVRPKYESSGIASCTTTRAGLPAWKTGEFSNSVNEMCFDRDAGTGVTTVTYEATDDVVAFEAAGGVCYNLDSGTSSDINLVVEDQNALHAINVDEANSLYWPGSRVFSSTAIVNMYDMTYGTELPCSNQGTCAEDSGLCECASGYTGAGCESTTEYV